MTTSTSNYSTFGRMAPPQKYKVPTTNSIIARVVLELLALFALGYPMLHIYVVLQGDKEPTKRGFFCDDENLKYPNVKEEISVGECVIIWTCIVLVFVPLVELLHFAVYEFSEWEQMVRQTSQEKWHCLSRIPIVVIELYRMLGYFFIGALGALLTTEMAKYKIGRLRPYFLTVCDIELTSQLCKDENNYDKFVTEYNCTGDEYEVREARKSFLSGHSSFSFYCSTFLVIYLQARLSRKQHRHCKKRENRRKFALALKFLRVLRPFLQFGFFGLALYIAFTRIADHKHHPTDIIAGIIVGVVFALIILLFLVDLFGRPRSFEEKVDEYDILGLQMETLLSPDQCATSSNGDPESHTCSSEVDRAKNTRQNNAPLATQEDDSTIRETRTTSRRGQSRNQQF